MQKEHRFSDSRPARVEAGAKESRGAARFWDRMAEGYAAKPIADEKAYAHKLALTREHLNADSEVLEIGCGTGSTALNHSPHVRYIRATDLSTRMIEIARQKAAARQIENIEFMRCEAADALGTERFYDAILALNLLHLSNDWPRLIRLIHRRLNAGGVFISSTPCLQSSHPWLRWLTPLGVRLGVLPGLSFFTREDLRTAIGSAGFDITVSWQASSKNGLFLVARKA